MSDCLQSVLTKSNHEIFPPDTSELDEKQKTLLRKLSIAVRFGNAREHIAATLPKLCECESDFDAPQKQTPRTHCPSVSIMCRFEIDLVDVFVKQLHKTRTLHLLHTHWLPICTTVSGISCRGLPAQHMMTRDDMKALKRDNKDLPNYVVDMLQLGCFDDAIGQIERFQIFGNIMQDGTYATNCYRALVWILMHSRQTVSGKILRSTRSPTFWKER